MLPIAHGLAMALTMLRAYGRCGNGVKNGAKTGLSSVFFASCFRLYARKGCAALTNRGEFAFLGGSPPFFGGRVQIIAKQRSGRLFLRAEAAIKAFAFSCHVAQQLWSCEPRSMCFGQAITNFHSFASAQHIKP